MAEGQVVQIVPTDARHWVADLSPHRPSSGVTETIPVVGWAIWRWSGGAQEVVPLVLCGGVVGASIEFENEDMRIHNVRATNWVVVQ